MAFDSEKSKAGALAWFDAAFVQKDPDLVVAEYMGDEYIQHNPMAPDGKDGFLAFFKGFLPTVPDFHSEIKRVIAEGDIVVIHHHVKFTKDELGTAVVDIFRMDENYKVVEHWDVLQPVPEEAANSNTMF
ncbi:unannotated protein [freshwater metagenome]|jgi:predicted SnoaL-like aldol condensation-catalyzing enzyme|uniref:Unannotated protein n=1 Tax=freshwater metagenome TaxID=449393 RepID=A0A6J7ICZ6_9ZZZZ|nr:hypothetical protein [Actinomycetota bacterium]